MLTTIARRTILGEGPEIDKRTESPSGDVAGGEERDQDAQPVPPPRREARCADSDGRATRRGPVRGDRGVPGAAEQPLFRDGDFILHVGTRGVLVRGERGCARKGGAPHPRDVPQEQHQRVLRESPSRWERARARARERARSTAATGRETGVSEAGRGERLAKARARGRASDERRYPDDARSRRWGGGGRRSRGTREREAFPTTRPSLSTLTRHPSRRRKRRRFGRRDERRTPPRLARPRRRPAAAALPAARRRARGAVRAAAGQAGRRADAARRPGATTPARRVDVPSRPSDLGLQAAHRPPSCSARRARVALGDGHAADGFGLGHLADDASSAVRARGLLITRRRRLGRRRSVAESATARGGAGDAGARVEASAPPTRPPSFREPPGLETGARQDSSVSANAAAAARRRRARGDPGGRRRRARAARARRRRRRRRRRLRRSRWTRRRRTAARRGGCPAASPPRSSPSLSAVPFPRSPASGRCRRCRTPARCAPSTRTTSCARGSVVGAGGRRGRAAVARRGGRVDAALLAQFKRFAFDVCCAFPGSDVGGARRADAPDARAGGGRGARGADAQIRRELATRATSAPAEADGAAPAALAREGTRARRRARKGRRRHAGTSSPPEDSGKFSQFLG